MKATLAYVEYPVKMSLSAKKQFKDATGLDLWNTLLRFIVSYRSTIDKPSFERIEALTSVVDFLTASELFYALFKSANSCVSLEEIQDGMEMVGGRQSDDNNEKCEVWPLVMVILALDIDKYYKENMSALVKKKEAISEQSQETPNQ